ncbi:DUF6166 domain-containing protein [Vibrio sp. 10N.261.46.E12]|uniref:DUF6166 domain-containing protein n=1 Tax=unclassified Vibrio TaxID=2614977 RepID=UPI000977DB73|nr:MULTISPECIES: DUF6166 domain-containing protein [unclassified Vibrio]OMO36471.1 hypothetical protein BH584_04085 [Vibrio sp. 10N.261.45.E1]PMJ22137.1 hypothetical protein BCU27_17125 [Vibrio sp. 10N.286.45.B6]PML97419.1 hypothetical protein BCT66_21075 [Vibrio sp. 10N.261.49.E11]PMM76551.1 hypothetical protein BCT48_01930 [Vibrio sp. 10N.261.46.F12]PMM82490.1 hypothetical protein BCT46_14155 [Vibrio sp. 10N.261.46.E8]
MSDKVRHKNRYYGNVLDKTIRVNDETLPVRSDILNFSSMFDWGDLEDRSAMTALSILAFEYGETSKQCELYQDLTRLMISQFDPNKDFLLTSDRLEVFFRNRV